MSINDPQWGNSHRPEQKDPEQVPESTGTEPVQPKTGEQDVPPAQESGLTGKNSGLGNPPPGNPPPELPPDLEELWQQLVYHTRCRIARLLGRPVPPAPSRVAPAPLSANAAPSLLETTAMPPELSGWQALTLKSWLIGVSLIVGAWLMSGFYLVDVQQRGVLSRFGSVVRVVDPGWHWRLPYPIDSVRLINVTAERKLDIALSGPQGRESPQGLMRTAEGDLVGLSYSVVYQVTDPVAYLSRAEQPTNLVSLLADEVLRRAVTAQLLSTLQAAVSQKNAPSDGWLAGTATQLQAAVEPLQLGITVKGLVLREVQLPAPVLQAMKDVDRQAQAQTKSLRDAQLGATERLIKAYKLAVNLRDESAAYAVALENHVRSLSSGSTADDQQARAQAQQDLATQAGLWRQQYPLLFSSQTALQGRIDPSSPNAAAAVPDKTAPANNTDTWRDREIMRSRDRVARPGSGS